MFFKWPNNTHPTFCYVWNLEYCSNSWFFSFKKKNWYVTNNEIFSMKFAIGPFIFLYDLLSSLSILQGINKNETFICISNWGESTKIIHFHSFLGISHSLCAPETARHTSRCLSSRIISWKGHKKRITCY